MKSLWESIEDTCLQNTSSKLENCQDDWRQDWDKNSEHSIFTANLSHKADTYEKLCYYEEELKLRMPTIL